MDQYRPLLMGLMDGELSPEEAAEVNRALTRSAALREEYERLRESSGKLQSLSMLEPGDRVLRSLWKSPYHRLALDGGIFLFIGGYLLLVGYGIYTFLNSEAPALPRVGIGAIAFGTIILLVTIIRERMSTHAVDPYREIER